MESPYHHPVREVNLLNNPGTIVFKNVSFSYPLRANVPVLQGQLACGKGIHGGTRLLSPFFSSFMLVFFSLLKV